MTDIPVPKGPYEVILETCELTSQLRVSSDTLEAWEKRGMSVMRDRPLGSKGRCIKRYDLWKVYQFLEGKT